MDAVSTVTITPTGPTMTYFPVTTPEPWPPVFLYGARPLSLDAAHIERDFGPDEQEQTKGLRLECPTGNSNTTVRTAEEEDADDQCLSANLFPAVAYTRMLDMSVWVYGGTYTPSGAPEKTWRCEMTEGEYLEEYETLAGGDCSLWESVSGADAASATTTSLGRCDVSRMYVPVRLTAGAVVEGGWGTGGSHWFHPTVANSEAVSSLSLERCPDPTSLVGFVAAAATTAPSGTGTGTGTSGSATGTASAAGEGRASMVERAGSAALFCTVLAYTSVVGLLSLPL